MLKQATLSLSVLALAIAAPAVMAKVSADEAAKLGKSLTPTGGIMKGNADGTIPEWTGEKNFTDEMKNMTYKQLEGMRDNPEELEETLGAQDTPVLFTITADNYKKYADKLTESQKAMFDGCFCQFGSFLVGCVVIQYIYVQTNHKNKTKNYINILIY